MYKINNDTYFIINSNCKLVKGVKRCLFVNHFNGLLDIMPIEIYNLIIGNACKKSILDILKDHKKSEQKIIQEYIYYLAEKKYINLLPKKELVKYSKVSDEKFLIPYDFTNCIIELDEHSDVEFLLSKIRDFIPNILIKISYDITYEKLAKIIYSFNLSSTEFIELHIHVKSSIKTDDMIKLFKFQQRLFKVILFGYEKTEIVYQQKDLSNYIINVNGNYSDNKCGVIDTSFFVNDKQHYNEALKYNTCLNKKISIDSKGNIKNCPSLKLSFGNIRDIDLQNLSSNKKFTKLWGIKKDDILVCKDCEFRFICSDCRAYLEDPIDLYSKPLKCGYDPYTGKWSNWSTNPLKQKAIEHYKMKDLINQQ